MSIRTITVQRLIENIVLQKTGKKRDEFTSHIDMIKIAEKEIFDNYPIYDESIREQLNVKILSHYYFREIIVTPWQKWRFYINESMALKMPYYNQLYETCANKYDVFENVDFTETLDRDLTSQQIHSNIREIEDMLNSTENNERVISDDISNTQNQTVQNESDTHRKFSDTPYTQLGNADYATDLTDENVDENSSSVSSGNQTQETQATDLNTKDEVKNTRSTSDNDTSGVNTEDYIKRTQGKMGTRSKTDLLIEYRKSILNVDEQVVKMLSDNFSGYYN